MLDQVMSQDQALGLGEAAGLDLAVDQDLEVDMGQGVGPVQVEARGLAAVPVVVMAQVEVQEAKTEPEAVLAQGTGNLNIIAF
jgi:hypothetical protein